MTKEQIEKILKVLIIVTFVMFAFELLFNFDQITTPITDWIQGQQGWLIYLSIFILCTGNFSSFNMSFMHAGNKLHLSISFKSIHSYCRYSFPSLLCIMYSIFYLLLSTA